MLRTDPAGQKSWISNGCSDYVQRLCGHCNTNTDIKVFVKNFHGVSLNFSLHLFLQYMIWKLSANVKASNIRPSNFNYQEAVWFGGRDEYIAAGSDCGSLLIWERKSGALIKGFEADMNILNCVQPHPSILLLATSGIEHVIRFWQPLDEDFRGVRFYGSLK